MNLEYMKVSLKEKITENIFLSNFLRWTCWWLNGLNEKWDDDVNIMVHKDILKKFSHLVIKQGDIYYCLPVI